ncbi:hypothetical protein SY28_07080 [Meiothermus taiwanensis]|nr:hypothetical protein SY28_07080 [Meiothermus taiwanensis]
MGGSAGSVLGGCRLRRREPDPGPDYLSKAGPALAALLQVGVAALVQVGVAALVQVGSGAVAPAGWAGLAPIVDGLLARVVALQAVLAALVRVEVAVLDPAGWSAAALLDWANSARAGRDPAHLDWMKAVRGLAGFHPFDRGVLRPG